MIFYQLRCDHSKECDPQQPGVRPSLHAGAAAQVNAAALPGGHLQS